jgi:tRNA G37 N-methylase TrmD
MAADSNALSIAFSRYVEQRLPQRMWCPRLRKTAHPRGRKHTFDGVSGADAGGIMQVDRYTKIMLTVIAAALVWLCVVLTPMGTSLNAQTAAVATQPAMRVVIAGWEGSGPRVQGNAGAPQVVTFGDLRAFPLPTTAK